MSSMCLLCGIFLFYGDGDHRDLHVLTHSFPTRRSSDLLRAGRLKILLEDYEPAPIPVHLVQLGGRRAPARVRAFVDFAASRLRRTLARSEEHTSELQSLMRISYAVFCLKKKIKP